VNDRETALDALTSWKEIAAYLGRSVRTVRRWETTEGLPVRRHRHRKASTVFAIREEIDAWRKQREERAAPNLENLVAAVPEPEPASAEPVAEPRNSPAWLRPAMAASLVATGLAAGWLTHAQLQPKNLDSVMQRALELDIVNGAVQLCQQTPQEPDCLLIQESVAQLRPADFRANYEASFALAAHGADLSRAENYSERAGKLLSEHVVSDEAEAAAWVLLFDARSSWARGDAAASLERANELEASLDEWPPRLRNLLARELGQLALALGRTNDAKSWFGHISDLDFRHEMLAWYLFAAGQKEQLMGHLSEEVTYREPFTAVLLAMAGEVERADELIDRLEQERLSSSHTALARGAIAFFSGNAEEAIGSLEATLGQMNESGDPIFFAGSDILAMARAKQGDLPQAIEALEMTQRQRDRAMFWSAGIHWIMCQSRLAGLYEASGQDQLQQITDDEIRERLRFADPDFPVLAALSERS
jgi:hypothetical protein